MAEPGVYLPFSLVRQLGLRDAYVLAQARYLQQGDQWWEVSTEKWAKDTGLPLRTLQRTLGSLEERRLLNSRRIGTFGKAELLVPLQPAEQRPRAILAPQKAAPQRPRARSARVSRANVARETDPSQAAFETGWAEHQADGPCRSGMRGLVLRPGEAPRGAWLAWGDLLAATGWPPEEALERWRRWRRWSQRQLKDPQYCPVVASLLDFRREYLTDDSLRALEARAGNGSDAPGWDWEKIGG